MYFLFYIVILVLIPNVDLTIFEVVYGIKELNTFSSFSVEYDNKALCIQYCLLHEQCKSANYNNQTLECELNDVGPDSSASNLQQINSWTLLYTKEGKLYPYQN